MPLPHRPFYSLIEAGARWSASPSDIAGWAADEQLELVATIPPVRAGKDKFAGVVAICAADILPMFRSDGSGPRSIAVWRVRAPGEHAWQEIADPSEGVMVAAADILVTGREAERFEQEHELGRPEPRRRDQPPVYLYDWDGMWVYIAKRLYDQGLPETQRAFVAEIQEWFIRRSEDCEAPDERSIRRRITPLWRALREEDGLTGAW